MDDKRTIQEYVNNFRRHLASHLKPGIGLSCKISPAKIMGAVIEFSIGPGISNVDLFVEPKNTVNSILEGVSHIFGSNIAEMKFLGTNISMGPNSIMLIKGENDPNLWNDQGAKNDVEKIIGTQAKARK